MSINSKYKFNSEKIWLPLSLIDARPTQGLLLYGKPFIAPLHRPSKFQCYGHFLTLGCMDEISKSLIKDCSKGDPENYCHPWGS